MSGKSDKGEDLSNILKSDLEDLESRSKKLSDLVFTHNFRVLSVCGKSHATFFTSMSPELIPGSRSPVYSGGFTSELILKVESEEDIPIKSLKFRGNVLVRSGDNISAKIPVCEEKNVGYLFSSVDTSYHNYNDSGRTFYLPRDIEPEETCIELQINSLKGNMIYRSVDYSKFFPE